MDIWRARELLTDFVPQGCPKGVLSRQLSQRGGKKRFSWPNLRTGLTNGVDSGLKQLLTR